MLAELDHAQLITLHHALCSYLDSPQSKSQFHNSDKGHPQYRARADGVTFDRLSNMGHDGPDTNTLYGLGHAVHQEAERRWGNVIPHEFAPGTTLPFASWHAFLLATTAAYDRHQATRQTSPVN